MINIRYHFTDGTSLAEDTRDLPAGLTADQVQVRLGEVLTEREDGLLRPLVTMTARTGERQLINTAHLIRVEVWEEEV